MHLHTFIKSSAAGLAALLVLSGCGKKDATGGDTAPAAATREDWVQQEDISPTEREYLEFGRTVVEAVADREYADFHALLSPDACARMSLNQFAPEDDDAAFARLEKQPRLKVALPEFLELMARTEKRFGQPVKPLHLHLHTADPAVLAGTKREGLDALDVMFAIGNMPATIPASARKASLRARIGVVLSAEELAATARHYETTVEALQQDPDFQPHLTLKLVLVAEADGQLRVGYFEFLPPSMMD